MLFNTDNNHVCYSGLIRTKQEKKVQASWVCYRYITWSEIVTIMKNLRIWMGINFQLHDKTSIMFNQCVKHLKLLCVIPFERYIYFYILIYIAGKTLETIYEFQVFLWKIVSLEIVFWNSHYYDKLSLLFKLIIKS